MKFKFTEAERVDIYHAIVSYDANPDYSLDSAIDRIEQIISERDGWISVEDVLPNPLDRVDVWVVPFDRGKPFRITNVKWELHFDKNTAVNFSKITHWQPLPKKPVN